MLPLIAAAAIPAITGGITALLGKKDLKRRRKRINSSYGNVANQFQGLAGMFGNQIQGYNNELQSGYLNSTEGSGMLNAIGESADNQRQQFGNLAGLSGLSDEALVSGLGRINQSEGRAVGNLAQNANNYRRNLQQMRSQAGNQQMMGLQNLFNTKRATENDVVQGNAAYMSNLSNSMGGAVSSGLSGMFDAGMFSDHLFRGNPKS